VLGARRKSKSETRKLRCAKPSAPKPSRRRMKPILDWTADAARDLERAGLSSIPPRAQIQHAGGSLRQLRAAVEFVGHRHARACHGHPRLAFVRLAFVNLGFHPQRVARLARLANSLRFSLSPFGLCVLAPIRQPRRCQLRHRPLPAYPDPRLYCERARAKLQL